MKKSKVSILMTVYNHQDYIKKAVQSVLTQSFKNFELIIINNGSTDNTKKIIKEFKDKRIKFYNLKKNIGRTKCLNFGLKKSKSEYIAIQDSDDISKKNRLKIQLNEFKKNKNLSLVASNYNIIDSKSKIVKKIIVKDDLYKYPKKLIFTNSIAHSTVMYRRKILKFIGNYPQNFVYAQDYALYLKIITRFKIKIIKNNLANLRINHKNSETYRLRNSISIRVEELKLALWALYNIRTNLFEKLKIFFKILIIFVKLFKSILPN